MSKGGGQTPAGDYLMSQLPANYERAQQIANQPFVAYTGQLTPTVPQAVNSGITAAQSVANYQPQQITAPIARAPTAQAASSGVYGLNTLFAPTPQASATAPLPISGAPIAPTMGIAAGRPQQPDILGMSRDDRRSAMDQYQAAMKDWRDARRAERHAGAPWGGGGDMQPVGAAGPAGPFVSAMQGLQGLDAYMNPYISQVADRTLADLDRFRQMATNQNSSNATLSGVFGGDRLGVENALTNEAFANQAATTLANLYNQGFNGSAGFLMGDKDRLLQNLQFNANLQQQAALANQQAQLQTALANQQTKLGADQANQQAGLEGANTNLAGAQTLGQLGGLQYGMEQDALTAAYNEFLRQQNNPIAMQDLLNKSLGMVGSAMQGQYNEPSYPLADFVAGTGNGLGGALVGKYSDKGLKANVKTAGFDARGRRWVDFRYVWDEPGTKRLGVIAQEVAITDPDAVSRDPASGFLMVDYTKLTE